MRNSVDNMPLEICADIRDSTLQEAFANQFDLFKHLMPADTEGLPVLRDRTIASILLAAAVKVRDHGGGRYDYERVLGWYGSAAKSSLRCILRGYLKQLVSSQEEFYYKVKEMSKALRMVWGSVSRNAGA